MGRPYSTPGVPLTDTISLRVDSALMAVWLAKVTDSGLSRSDFFRRAILENSTLIEAVSPMADTHRQLVAIFAGASIGLNRLGQNADLLHGRGELGGSTYASILAELAAIRLAVVAGVEGAELRARKWKQAK